MFIAWSIQVIMLVMHMELFCTFTNYMLVKLTMVLNLLEGFLF